MLFLTFLNSIDEHSAMAQISQKRETNVPAYHISTKALLVRFNGFCFLKDEL